MLVCNFLFYQRCDDLPGYSFLPSGGGLLNIEVRSMTIGSYLLMEFVAKHK